MSSPWTSLGAPRHQPSKRSHNDDGKAGEDGDAELARIAAARAKTKSAKASAAHHR